MPKSWIVILVGISVLTASNSLNAQIFDPGKQRPGTYSSTGGAWYNFSSGTGCDLKVAVWGFVNAPGRYDVPCETNLLELLSFCGGPRQGADMSEVKVVRRGGVDKENELKEVFTVDLTQYLKITNEAVTPPELLLFPGDLVIIEGEETTVDNFLRIAQVVVAITSLVTATVAVINITK